MNNKIINLFVIIIIIYILTYKSVNYFTSNLDQFNTEYNLPKIIWTHWDNIDNVPLLIKHIFELREEKLKDWPIKMH